MTRRPESAASFSADWLRQREPFDAAARDAAAPRLGLDAALAAWRAPAGAPLRVIDLACGTGANLRWLAPRLGGAQQWLVVDHDAALLRQWPDGLAAHGAANAGKSGKSGRSGHGGADRHRRSMQLADCGFHAAILRRRLDLARGLESLPWHAVRLVTASALLDLVSAAWLQRLVAATAAARVALLMALSVDGRHRWVPGDADDPVVAALFGAHQQRDKGFDGPALGAAAAPALVLALRRCGYDVHRARSDWLLDGRHEGQALALQLALIDGMATAALEQAPTAAARIQAWRQRRLALGPASVLRVGHLDVLALPRQ